ncbi:MAG TPA: hypothetical protein VG206_09130 [Terriglobia bacterium]|nr:hypothetical protein [Terriglobia bacterium]
MLNSAGPGTDLVVGTAIDARGLQGTLESEDGFYIQRSNSNCAADSEGGLPAIATTFETFSPFGAPVLAADRGHSTFFAADLRLGQQDDTAVGVLRTTAANLLSATACPSGTQTNSATCWPTGNVVNSVPLNFIISDPQVAVDSRTTGTGAGDVYLVGTVEDANNFPPTRTIFLAACTNAQLSCSSSAVPSGSDNVADFPWVQVRPDGGITVTYVNTKTFSSAGFFPFDVKFVSCTPQGAPKAPTCGAPALVTTENNAMEGTAPGDVLGRPTLPAAPFLFLASGQGRGLLEATHHPLAQFISQAFGEKADAPIPPSAATMRQLAMVASSNRIGTKGAAGTVPCTGSAGARFNLEPRANAVPQSEEMADFIPRGVAAGDDLIVQVADDFRGNLATDPNWDQSLSGYYVHRSTTADCSVQFEGGLPSFQFQGKTVMGIGDTVVAADPMRDAVFVADVRFGNAGGVGLFRSSTSTLLNTSLCPNGTHLQTQAASCWEVTTPALVFGIAAADVISGQPRITVDERATGVGTGAGDVYVVAPFNNAISIAACTNSTLTCGPGAAIPGTDANSNYPYVQVRSDGLITVSYIETSITSIPETISFVNCTPAGAPNQPVCGTPTTVATLNQPLGAFVQDILENEPVNLNLSLVQTYPKHADRQDSTGKFTTFLVYDDCKDVFNPGNGGTQICVAAEVLMTFSTDSGKTWSTPVSVDTAAGHDFFPAISTDASTGTTNLVYYSTEKDTFKHEVSVVLNQIAAGSTTVGAAQILSNKLDIDDDPGDQGFLLFGTFIGTIARGNGTPGQSHLYTSFDSTAANGTYGGKSLPESNNTIMLHTF